MQILICRADAQGLGIRNSCCVVQKPSPATEGSDSGEGGPAVRPGRKRSVPLRYRWFAWFLSGERPHPSFPEQCKHFPGNPPSPETQASPAGEGFWKRCRQVDGRYPFRGGGTPQTGRRGSSPHILTNAKKERFPGGLPRETVMSGNPIPVSST